MAIIGYEITSGAYFLRGRRHLKYFMEPGMLDHLFYAALEFRNAIERLLFEYLHILAIEDWEDKWEKAYQPKKLKAIILNVEPEFERKAEFLNLYCGAVGLPVRTEAFDLDKWNSLYGRLGNFLHGQKRPEETSENKEWWEGFVALIKEVGQAIANEKQQPMGSMTLNEEGLELYRRWNVGEISEEEVRTEIQTAMNDHSG